MPGLRNSSQTFNNREAELIEEKIQCPYNRSHQILPQRFIRHLVICRRDCLSSKTNPFFKRAQEIKICQFNQSHHVHKADMESHLEICESAKMYKQSNKLGEEVTEEHVSLMIKEGDTLVNDVNGDCADDFDDEEDWDKEMEGKELLSYDPMKKVLERNFAVNSACKSDGERRDIRAMQRLGDKEGLSYLLADGGIIAKGASASDGGKKRKGKKRSTKSKALPVGMM